MTGQFSLIEALVDECATYKKRPPL